MKRQNNTRSEVLLQEKQKSQMTRQWASTRCWRRMNAAPERVSHVRVRLRYLPPVYPPSPCLSEHLQLTKQGPYWGLSVCAKRGSTGPTGRSHGGIGEGAQIGRRIAAISGEAPAAKTVRTATGWLVLGSAVRTAQGLAECPRAGPRRQINSVSGARNSSDKSGTSRP